MTDILCVKFQPSFRKGSYNSVSFPVIVQTSTGPYREWAQAAVLHRPRSDSLGEGSEGPPRPGWLGHHQRDGRLHYPWPAPRRALLWHHFPGQFGGWLGRGDIHSPPIAQVHAHNALAQYHLVDMNISSHPRSDEHILYLGIRNT